MAEGQVVRIRQGEYQEDSGLKLSGMLARHRLLWVLIWGRHDRATPLSVAEAASARFGWPLHVIEDCNDDPPVEQPDALLRALRDALGGAWFHVTLWRHR